MGWMGTEEEEEERFGTTGKGWREGEFFIPGSTWRNVITLALSVIKIFKLEKHPNHQFPLKF